MRHRPPTVGIIIDWCLILTACAALAAMCSHPALRKWKDTALPKPPAQRIPDADGQPVQGPKTATISGILIGQTVANVVI